ncbi:neutral/alkaline non-lysosomal ceramidase N-terminal domain-containing protein [candidate division KSB1 bacterium]|nr:neutral/alkaline non-lysosomal ceramidase N-terminal domain-containing protein [candidate division KSB1 bacterium]
MLKAGASKLDITPQVGTDLAGYLDREESSQGVHDDLYVKALVLDDGKQKVAIVTCDLLAICRSSVNVVRKAIEEVIGINGDNVMITATHTHSGPATISSLGLGEVNRAWLNVLHKKMIDVVYDATKNMQQVTIGAGKGKAEIGVNREGKIPSGSLILVPNPRGPIDPEVGVVRINDRNENIFALLINFGCHAVVLESDNLLISADFPGYATEMVEKAKNNGVIALFTNGGAGNVNPKRRGTFEEIAKLGTTLGSEALKVAEQIETTHDGNLDVYKELIKLPLKVPTSKDIEETIKDYEGKVKESVEGKASNLDIKIAKTLLKWAKRTQAVMKQKRMQKNIYIEVQVFIINNIALIGIPGEPFAEFVLEIKNKSKFEYTFVAGYANGYYGYIPHKNAYRRGGYGVTDAFKYFGFPGALAPESTVHLSNSILELLHGSVPSDRSF